MFGGSRKRLFSSFGAAVAGLSAASGKLSPCRAEGKRIDAEGKRKKSIQLPASWLHGLKRPKHLTIKEEAARDEWSRADVTDASGDKRILVTHGDGVFDVTDFVQYHPGAHYLILANGGALENWWQIYNVHRAKPEITRILEKYRIGTLREEDRVSYEEIDEDNPFAADPERHPELVVYQPYPLDAGTPKRVLAAHYYTPPELFYVRNHMPVPEVEPSEKDAHEIFISIPGELCKEGTVTNSVSEPTEATEFQKAFGYEGPIVEQTFTLRELRETFKKTTVDAALFCTGFRETDIEGACGEKVAVKGKPQTMEEPSLQIGNGMWTGVRMRDVLLKMGLDEEKLFAQQSDVLKDPSGRAKRWYAELHGLDGFQLCVPLEVLVRIDRDCVLAEHQNGKPLLPDHGFPLRLIVPGFAASRSMKFIDSITIQDMESVSPWHTRMYRLFNEDTDGDGQVGITDVPMVTDEEALWHAPACLEGPINSVFFTWTKCEDGDIMLRGAALGGGGRRICKVQLSCDGNHWTNAEILDTHTKLHKGGDWGNPADYKKTHPEMFGFHRNWSWFGWQCKFPKSKFVEKGGKVTFSVKATNDCYDSQPPEISSVWNMRGYLVNSYDKITVKL